MSPVIQGLRHGKQNPSFRHTRFGASALATGSEFSAVFRARLRTPALQHVAFDQAAWPTARKDHSLKRTSRRCVSLFPRRASPGRQSRRLCIGCDVCPGCLVSPTLPSSSSCCCSHFILPTSLSSAPSRAAPPSIFDSPSRASASAAGPKHQAPGDTVAFAPLAGIGTPTVFCFSRLGTSFFGLASTSGVPAGRSFVSTRSSPHSECPLSPGSRDASQWNPAGDSRHLLEAMYVDEHDDACHARTRRLERKRRKKKPVETKTTGESSTRTEERSANVLPVSAGQRECASPPQLSGICRDLEDPPASADISVLTPTSVPSTSAPSTVSSYLSAPSPSRDHSAPTALGASAAPSASPERLPPHSPHYLDTSSKTGDVPSSSSSSARYSSEVSPTPFHAPSFSSALLFPDSSVRRTPAVSAPPLEKEKSAGFPSSSSPTVSGEDPPSPSATTTADPPSWTVAAASSSSSSSASLSSSVSEALSRDIAQKYQGVEESPNLDGKQEEVEGEDDDDDDPLALFCSHTSSSLTPPPLKPTPPKASSRRLTARAYQLHRQGSDKSNVRTNPNAWMSEPQVLVKMLYKAARNNIRDEKLWKTFVQRVCLTAVNMKADQLALVLYSFARVRYFDARVPHTLTPYILKLLDDFSAQGLSLLLNSFKKLRLHKYDTMELIINQLCFHMGKCSSQDLALAANSLSYFYIYHSKFWKLLLKSVPRLKPRIEPRHAVLLVGSFARIDLRDGSTLLLLSHILKKHAGTLDQAQLSVAVAAFSKLDFTHPKLTISFHRAIHQLFARDPDAFDNQALCLLIHATICLTGGSEQLIRKLLHGLVKRNPLLAVHQTRKLRHAAIVLQSHHRGVDVARRLSDLFSSAPFSDREESLFVNLEPPQNVNVRFPRNAADIYEGLDENVRQFLKQVKNATAKELGDHGSRWAIEVAWTLQEMGVSFQRRLLVNGCRIDIFLPEKKIAIICAGPHHFYLDSTRRTSYSRLQQNLLELQAYLLRGQIEIMCSTFSNSSFSVCVLPYYEWSELHTPEEKQRFLWAFGRRAAMELKATSTREDDEALEEEEDSRRRVPYKSSFEDDPAELVPDAEHVGDGNVDDCIDPRLV